MIAVDTSVVVAAFASWHEAHERAAREVARQPGLPAPVALETYAVLTRLPPPHRAAGLLVRDFLQRAFPQDLLTLSAARTSSLVSDLVDMGVVGGAAYDAVIAITASEHGCEVLTLDARARATYERVGVVARLLPVT